MVRDFAPVTLLGTIPFVLSVHPAVPVTSVDELVKLARAKPGELNYGSGGNGSPGHLIGEMFKSRTGVNIVHVPYKTVAQGVTALIGEQVQVNFVVGAVGGAANQGRAHTSARGDDDQAFGEPARRADDRGVGPAGIRRAGVERRAGARAHAARRSSRS